MTCLLDTNAVIVLLKNQPNTVRKQLRRAAAKGASLMVSSAVLFELWYGVARNERRRQNAERLRAFLSGTIGVVPKIPEPCPLALKLQKTEIIPCTGNRPANTLVRRTIAIIPVRPCYWRNTA